MVLQFFIIALLTSCTFSNPSIKINVNLKPMKKLIPIFMLTAATLSTSAQNGSAKLMPINMESVSPNIFVNNIHKTVEFYKILGFEVNAAVPDKDNPVFVLMTCGSTTFMFQTFSSIGDSLPTVSRQNGGSLLLYIKMKGIRAFYEKIKDKVTVLQGLETTFYGATEFSIKDINSYVLTFAEDE